MSELTLIIGEIIIGIALLAVLSAVITVVVVRLLSPTSRADEILRLRYAQGELTRDEFIQRRRDIESHSGPASPELRVVGAEEPEAQAARRWRG